MCGRVRCTLDYHAATREAKVPAENVEEIDKYSPVENLGPGRFSLVVYRPKQNASKSFRALRAMKWGLIPSFWKAENKLNHFVMFNARSESLTERTAYQHLVQRRRCIVVAEGYYEWRQLAKREKQPYYFHNTAGNAIKFAALYDIWKGSEEELYTCSIITVDASREFEWLHTRMPVILKDDEVEEWLSDAKFDDVKHLLRSYTGNDLEVYPVTKKVGSTKYQENDCSKRVPCDCHSKKDRKCSGNFFMRAVLADITKFFTEEKVKPSQEIVEETVKEEDCLKRKSVPSPDSSPRKSARKVDKLSDAKNVFRQHDRKTAASESFGKQDKATLHQYFKKE